MQGFSYFILNYPQFFVGLAIVFLGLLAIYDYPQLQFLDNLSEEQFLSLEEDTREKYSRLQTEILIAVAMISFGSLLLVMSILGRKLIPGLKD